MCRCLCTCFCFCLSGCHPRRGPASVVAFLSPPKPCHFDRSCSQPHREQRSGETRFSTHSLVLLSSTAIRSAVTHPSRTRAILIKDARPPLPTKRPRTHPPHRAFRRTPRRIQTAHPRTRPRRRPRTPPPPRTTSPHHRPRRPHQNRERAMGHPLRRPRTHSPPTPQLR